MVFSSLIFLFAFLPAVLALYAVCPRAGRRYVLIAAGILFCAYNRPASLLPLVFVSAAAFLFARAYERVPRAICFWCGIAVVLLPLICYKFVPYFSRSGLPQGISFYTFSHVAYLADVKRGRIRAERRVSAYACFSTLLPLLGAGPILRYGETEQGLSGRRADVLAFGAGVGRFCCGLGKKLIFGDAFAGAFRYFRALSDVQPTVAGAWLTVLCFTLHLYYDFSGYTDMAIGVGRMFGMRFPENFDYPFCARSITDFWRRWHQSLSRWFRDYVYIPLGGNRRGRLRQCANLAAVWLLTGIWHGTGWNFLIWGAYFCLILICEHLFLRRILERLPAWIAHIYTLLLVLISFLIFSYGDLRAGLTCLGALFGVGTVGVTSVVAGWQILRLLPLLVLAGIGSTPLPRRLWGRICYRIPALFPVGAVATLALCAAYLLDSSFLPFAYLNF